ncbi:7,8-didemethyl-8-hydroxy-5-deazariboflavin synthase CofG [Microbacterium dauci]|uniref:7,8-didemethyl-8-hydroxy-5-deazariboflavin synthase n=1 Tax=Microbacterium dauci TaxID=3048008 RepID=A0ABT6ZGA0_9MICO|nr:7,8-didemethyl-8-hydroxy-5-deazariboflavin synthase CofG [Microbacterium sp. LX3-4]MDJ1114662.1 7,8-didemethyl-8-hydroxy-5-deazariboflavin synthase CofG [Microbacterium sp. LX3-4]
MSVDRVTDPAEAERLLAASGVRLDALLERAGAMRDEGLVAAGRPGVVTYSRKVFLPLTTLCRDRCHYCAFVDTPAQLLRKQAPAYLSDEQILRVARAGHAQGCKEALLTLGDRPEARWPEARAWLDEHGFASTIDYVAHAARLVTAETGLLAHANPGVMTPAELATLRPVAPSMGMMLETTSRALFETPGAAHYGSPDKDPALRLQVIEDAGAARVPFTSGILVGIGETLADRAASMFALRDAHARHGHLQEVIVQNFRAKPRTAMHDAPDADRDAYLAAVAVARLVLGPAMRIQAPPNLSDPAELALLLRAGVDDWGGVSPLTADHVNPERPWPHLDDLAAHTAAEGFTLTERLTAHPEYVRAADEWIDPALHREVARLADPVTGLAAAAPSPSSGRRRADALLERAATAPRELDAAEWERLLVAEGRDLERLVAVADDVRRLTVGDTVSIVVNRNLTSSGLRAAASGFGEFTLDDAADIARDAAALGATELCIQGRMDAALPPSAYLDLVRTVRAATPDVHLHAYRPHDIADLVDRGGMPLAEALRQLIAAGVDTFPGTGVKVLDDDVRRRIAPDDLDVDRWLEIVRAAHGAGLRSTSVLFYGHVETAAQRIAHLLALRGIHDETGGFSEFVPIPLPGHGSRLADRAPLDEHRAMAAVSRLLLNDGIRHIQIPWTRHGTATAAELLRAGGDDLGGTLLDGRVRPDTGVEQGLELHLAAAERLVSGLFRRLRVRTTDYGTPGASSERAA